MSNGLTAKEISRLKGEGFIFQRDKEHFVCRVITVDGNLKPREVKKLADISEKYGYGYISFTSRLTVEIPGIKYEKVEKVKRELEKVGLYPGGTGPKVRPITSCKGTVCKFGLMDTQMLNRKIHDRFYLGWNNVILPHKFKIGVGGCPNNCAKPNLNDFGIIAQRKPKLDYEACAGCKKCRVEDVCKVGAVKRVDEKITIDFDKCNNCGLCIEECHLNAVKIDKEGVKIFIGGKWGKFPKIGEPLKGIHTEEEALNIIEKAILYYKANGIPGERFGEMIDRIGFNEVEKELLSDDILEQKEEILKNKTGGEAAISSSC
ncbi:4Fe-4S binding protein [Thermohalobacter berrensis]|uniref:(4Fe-4S)-binding protein n=1 Tax=Thermohalobacter berrensis TaxID=99594 RepID=A0A419SWB9_9FIRM|nr:4Fe-4S binding protein [Thermohalobacter berrensis]RKD29527.1 (4Fe-4S)-binding protein [Thermohalobacter berrensis]